MFVHSVWSDLLLLLLLPFDLPVRLDWLGWALKLLAIRSLVLVFVNAKKERAVFVFWGCVPCNPLDFRIW
jgi:hypothetical protein